LSGKGLFSALKFSQRNWHLRWRSDRGQWQREETYDGNPHRFIPPTTGGLHRKNRRQAGPA
jgi:hypothetical protein